MFNTPMFNGENSSQLLLLCAHSQVAVLWNWYALSTLLAATGRC